MKKFIIFIGIIILIPTLFISFLFTKQKNTVDDVINIDNIEYIDDIKHIIVYNLPYNDGVKCTLKTLQQYGSYRIDTSKIIYKNEDFVLWKGDKFGTLKFNDDKEVDIRVSVYGNFFSIAGQKGYYVYENEIE